MTQAKARWVLAVEDEESDALILREAFAERPGAPRLEVARRVADGLALLGERTRADDPPAFVLLDWKLTGESGRDFLLGLRNETGSARRVPVVVFSTSRAAADVRAAYDAGANAYCAKPLAFDELLRLLDALLGFWLACALLP